MGNSQVQAQTNEQTEPATSAWILGLHRLLLNLHNNPYPFIPNPPNCKKRAAVSCILRIRPTYPDDPTQPSQAQNLPYERILSSFFEQPWVRRGDLEVLFIKRATRRGDRWTSQIALPGGKRDPGDPSDEATSIRETMEEVGLDLRADHVLAACKLPERVVMTEWGTTPLMVLCPFVYLLTRFDVPPLKLQPTEVSSAHWVPVRALLSPSCRTYERADIADRLAHRRGSFVRRALRAMMGQMLYAAIRLVPSESVYCTSAPSFLRDEATESSSSSILSSLANLLPWGHAKFNNPERELVLWGLTHGMIADFLSLLHSEEKLVWWRWPTLSSLDMRLAIWLFSYQFRKRKVESLLPANRGPPFIIDEGLGTVKNPSVQTQKGPDRKVSERTQESNAMGSRAPVTRHSAVGHMFEGYYEIIRIAIFTTLALRAVVALGLVMAYVLAHRREHHIVKQ